VQLVEIPTVDETFDNIVAFWNPLDKAQAGPGAAVQLSPVLGHAHAFSSPLAQTIATRTGIGGTVGVKRQYYSWHFAVDFAGGELGALPRTPPVEAVITTSRGTTEHVTAHYVEEFNGYRALFDVRPTTTASSPSICAVSARRRQAADRNLDLSVDAAVREGTQARALAALAARRLRPTPRRARGRRPPRRPASRA
jgi:glucan biosynthesis protein